MTSAPRPVGAIPVPTHPTTTTTTTTTLTTCAHRATVVHARVARGHTVLVTGIGGGVALLAMQLCLALGARVYVTSGSDAKLARAIALGATGGVNYTHGESAFFSASSSSLPSLPCSCKRW